MPQLENARHELFALLVARGDGSESACYLKAGFRAKNDATARACASRLLAVANVGARVAELKAQFTESVKAAFTVSTTDVARHLWQLSHYDITDVLEIKTTRRKQKVTIKDTKDWPTALKHTCQGIKVSPDGTIQLLLPDRRMPAAKVGEHLGMFTGESAGTINVTDNSRAVVFVDAPRNETVEQWRARVAKERGMKLIEVEED